MKTMKKIVAVLMVIVMAAALAPTAFAALLPTSYDIWICDTQITEKNKDDVFNDGTISYDPETSTLTLNDAFIAASGMRNSGITVGNSYYPVETLNIVLNGDSYIYGKESASNSSISAGIHCYYCTALNFKGDGTATIKGYDNGSYTAAGIYGSQSTTLNVESGKLTIIGKNFKYYSFTDDCRVKESSDSFTVTHKSLNPLDSFFDIIAEFAKMIGDFFISIGNFFKNIFR